MHNPPLSRRSILSWAVGLGAAVPAAGLLTACGSDGGTTGSSAKGDGPGSNKTARTYQTAFGYNVGNAPEMVAKEAGYFADLGIDGKVISSTGTPQAMTGLLSSGTHYSRFQSISALVSAANEDAPFVAFGTPVQRSAFEMQSQQGKAIKEITQLEGKTVGVVSAGGTTDQLIDLMAVRAGVEPKSIKRKVVGLGTAAYQFAENGDIQAWVGSAAERLALDTAGKKVHAFNFDDVVAIPADSYITTRDEYEKNRDVVVKVLAAFYQALTFVCDEANDKQTIEWVRKYNREITPDAAQIQLGLVRELYLAAGKDKLMVVDEAKWADMQKALLDAKITKKELDLEKVVDAGMLEEAKALL